MNDFTIDDLQVLMEAMEAWENKDGEGQLLGSLLGAMLIPKDAPQHERESFEANRAKEKREYEEGRAVRKERSILLRAKLIGLLDRARAETLISQ